MANKDRSGNREQRRSDKAKRANHEPLLRMVAHEPDRRHTRPRQVEVKPLTFAQERYDSAIRAHHITFGIGPAGTGKTWLAATRAAEALVNKEIERIVITRPAVEAGESLGFLPGEMDEKYAPYFRPVRDALEEYLGTGRLEYELRAGNIEARPLGLLRGSTRKHAWVLADEMQNATVPQMKMLLTRIGEGSRFIINGDPSQFDLPGHVTSGLGDAVRRLARVNGVAVIHFEAHDIVRHGIIRDLIAAYASPNETPCCNCYNTRIERIERIESDDAGLKRVLGAA